MTTRLLPALLLALMSAAPLHGQSLNRSQRYAAYLQPLRDILNRP